MATSTMTSTATTNASVTAPLLPRKRHSGSKKPDPFFDLPITPSPPSSPPQSPPAHPTDAHNNSNNDSNGATATAADSERADSLLYRTLVTPFLFTSFLVSLFLVNRQDLSRRAAAHPSSATAHSRFYHISPGSWLSPEPYQNPRTGTWHVGHPLAGRSGVESSVEVGGGASKGWFYRKKHRAMAQLEIGDAFEMRKRVLAGLIAATVLGVTGTGWVLWRTYEWVISGW
jgi:hypothetical protein